MKKLVIFLSVILFIGSSYASQNGVKILAMDDTVESNLCVIAGEEGYSEAVKQAKKLEVGIVYVVKCNGESLRSFANNFNVQPAMALEITKVKLVPADTNDASEICILAVKEGIKVAADATDNDIRGITCNGISIERFSKKYAEL